MNLNNIHHYTYDNWQEQNQKERENRAIEFLKLTNLTPLKPIGAIKNCKWCGRVIFEKDDDDFCSPECLEKYALEFLKKKK